MFVDLLSIYYIGDIIEHN